MSMIWLLARILLPLLIRLRKQQDNSRLESRSGISYADCTHSSSRVEASFPECGHGVDGTPSSPTSTSTSTSTFTTRSLRHFNYPIQSGTLNQTFWSFSLQFFTTVMGMLTSLPMLQFNKGVWRSVNVTDAGAGEEKGQVESVR
jgi:hypothetical protein